MVDIAEAAAHSAVADILGKGGDALVAPCDVTKRDQVNALIQKVLDTYGQIDILGNNAGITRDARLIKMTEEDFDCVIDVNLKGAFNMAQAVAGPMIERGYGRIISTASVVALYGNFGQSNCVATKAG